MSRRQKSKELALIEAITGLGAMGVVAFMFVPGFREMVQAVLLLGVIGVLIVVAVWLLIKFFKAEPFAGFKTIYAETVPAPNPVLVARQWGGSGTFTTCAQTVTFGKSAED